MIDHLRFRAVPLCLVLLGGCLGEATAPRSPLRPTGLGEAKRIMEVTIAGIGTADMAAWARFPGADPGGPEFDLSAVGNSGGGGDGTIQLQSVGSGSFKYEEPDGTMVRYLYATFRVRNAQQNGTPYDTPRQNLTFVAVSTASTIGDTPISDLRLFDEGLPADPLLAFEIRPTGAVVAGPHDGVPLSAGPDALQVLTEIDAAAVDEPTYVRSVFPYGFVVRNASNPSTRTLPANPGADQFDGVVTFAFKVPLQPTPSEDPFRIRMSFLALDDSETRITQSLEEQTPAALAAMQARASALGATTITTLPGARLPGARPVCSVRTAGTALAPTHFMVRRGAQLTPDPYAGGASFVATSSSISAEHGDLVFRANPQTFVVNGSHRGRYFASGPFTGNGTTNVSSPAGSFFPGEELEVTLTATLRTCAPQVARYRVAAGVASATFGAAPGSPVPFTGSPQDIDVVDLNRDGRLDLAVTQADQPGFGPSSIRFLLGDGAGGFTQTTPVLLSGNPARAVRVGDLNDDGRLDLVVPVFNVLRVYLDNGAGGYDLTTTGFGSNSATAVALGDLNADGFPDIALAQTQRLIVLLNNGLGQFATVGSPLTITEGPSGVEIGDLDRNGTMDLVVTNSTAGSPPIRVYLGDGSGGFGPASGVAFGTLGRSAHTPRLADFNGDGRLDVAALSASPSPNTLMVLLGDGAGGLSPAPGSTVLGTDFHSSSAVGDLNGDGRLDLAITRQGSPGSVVVLLGNGAGQFVPAPGSPVVAGAAPHTAALGDFNGDGRLDVVVSNAGAANLSVLLNQP